MGGLIPVAGYNRISVLSETGALEDGRQPTGKKLLIKPGHKILLTNAPEGFTLGALPEGAETKASGDGPFDHVMTFVYNKADVDRLAPAAIRRVRPGGFLWFAYPKQTSKIKTDIHRGVGWDAVRNTVWEGIALVAVDDTWSAMRYRPASEVRSRKKD
jgi:hypothetical protein